VLAHAAPGTVEPDVPPADAARTTSSRLHALLHLAWARVIRPLRDFGFGRRNIWEGGVGLFVVGGFGARVARACPPRAAAATHALASTRAAAMPTACARTPRPGRASPPGCACTATRAFVRANPI
jgi:hypothetical protein